MNFVDARNMAKRNRWKSFIWGSKEYFTASWYEIKEDKKYMKAEL